MIKKNVIKNNGASPFVAQVSRETSVFTAYVIGGENFAACPKKEIVLLPL